MKKLPVFCKDCKWSWKLKDSDWEIRCLNPHVNANSSWALSCGTEISGTAASTERSDKSWFAKCGMKGKLWEPKDE